MSHKHIDVTVNGPAATIFLNRAEVKNAFNPEMISELISAVKVLNNDPGIQVIVVKGKNGAFSSGADLNWLRESGSKSSEQNRTDSRLISDLMQTLQQIPVPLISVTEGAVFGGAIGILGCSDWVLSMEDSHFAFSEVKLGLAPAIIMPYVLLRSNSQKIKQLMLTGQSFDAWEALDAGLTDRVGPDREISLELNNLVSTMIHLPGTAVREIKRLWNGVRTGVQENTEEMTIESLTRLKQSEAAQDLLAKFLNKK